MALDSPFAGLQATQFRRRRPLIHATVVSDLRYRTNLQAQNGRDAAAKRAAALEARCAGLQADALRASALDRRCTELQSELSASQQVHQVSSSKQGVLLVRSSAAAAPSCSWDSAHRSWSAA